MRALVTAATAAAALGLLTVIVHDGAGPAAHLPEKTFAVQPAITHERPAPPEIHVVAEHHASPTARAVPA
ncbi:MAG: hypothetical protein ACRELX_05075, partial [Longimicrobiales bacterium]